MPDSALQHRIKELVEKHGSLRAAARVLRVDAGYLHRLWRGGKKEPSDSLLKRMGLRRVVYYMRTTQDA